MSKPKITLDQKRAIDDKVVQYGFDKALVVLQHAKAGNSWAYGYECLNDLDLDDLCRYLYAPDTVEVEMSVDERLVYSYNNGTTFNGTKVTDSQNELGTFQYGVETALRIIGRQTPGVITWEE